MKTLVLILVSVLSIAARAQETSVLQADVEPPRRTDWLRKFNAGVQGFSSRTEGKGSTSGELTFGYSILENLDVRVGVGRIGDVETTNKGGDLKDWTEFEENSKLESNYAAIDLRGVIWRSPKKYHAIYVSAGLGTMWSKATYDYTRYKPYNGWICFIGDCTRAVEESASGRDSFTSHFERASVGYEFTFGRGPVIAGYSFFAGLNAFKIRDGQTVKVGNEKRNASVDTDMIGAMNFALGSSIQF